MKTPKEFKKMLDSGIITDEIVGMCLYSINKRAKNYRDKEWENRGRRYGLYSLEYRLKKETLYQMKDKFLNYFHPMEIHNDGNHQYYYYEIGQYKFHQPCKNLDIGDDYPVVNISELYNAGKEIEDLISLQFCEKVLDALASGKCHIITAG